MQDAPREAPCAHRQRTPLVLEHEPCKLLARSLGAGLEPADRDVELLREHAERLPARHPCAALDPAQEARRDTHAGGLAQAQAEREPPGTDSLTDRCHVPETIAPPRESRTVVRA